jgi:hypothetical protein
MRIIDVFFFFLLTAGAVMLWVTLKRLAPSRAW